MRACLTMLGIGLLAGGLAGAALAQPLPTVTQPRVPGTLPPLRAVPDAPPPPGRGYCTQVLPCRSALNEPFYYTPSGDRQYLSRR